jgi:hypothetical protein
LEFGIRLITNNGLAEVKKGVVLADMQSIPAEDARSREALQGDE